MTIKAVLFDMDGVLIDARDWHYEALNKALDLFGLAINRDAHLSVFDGLPTRRKLEIITASRSLPRALHGFLNDLKQAYTAEITYARCRPVFQHQFALSRLKAKGFKLAVCSNSIAATVSLMMDLSNLSVYLDQQFSNESVKKPKPAPDIYIEAMKTFGLQPEECLIVEDNEHGIQAARSSGGHVLVVSSPAEVTFDRIEQAISEIEGD